MVKLLCAVVGVAGSVFPVDIATSETVGDLKDAIKAENSATIACDAKDLQLFLARKDDAWLKDDDPVALQLEIDDVRTSTTEGQLEASWTIEEVLETHNMTRRRASKSKQIHVLVVVPNRAASGAPTTPLAAEQATLGVEGPSEAKRRRMTAITSTQMEKLVEIAAMGQQLDPATDLKVGNVLAVPETVLGTAFFNGLYIRQEYWDLHGIIKQELASVKSLRRVLVVGSPGIGKSVFGVFMLLLFLAEKKDVAYRPLGNSLIYYFSWDSTDGYEISETPLADKSYEGLFDGNEAGGALNYDYLHVFVFASPRTVHFHQFVKESCFKVYMSPWTKAECQSFADAIDVEDEDEWYRRFNLVGGKPRFLFSLSHDFDDLVKDVHGAIPHTFEELKDQLRLVQQNIFDDRMKHILFNISRDDDKPSRCYLTYSSLAVEVIVSTRYNAYSAGETRLLLQTPAPNL